MATPLFDHSRHEGRRDQGAEGQGWGGPTATQPSPGRSATSPWAPLWGLFLVLGAASVVLGALVVAWPGVTVVVAGVIFGIQLLIFGVFRLVQAIVDRDASGGVRTLLAVVGVLSLIVGVLCLRHIAETIAVLVVILGLFWLISGVIEIFQAVTEHDQPHRGFTSALGVLSVIAGIIVLAWPGVSVLALTVVLGIWLIVFGISAIGQGMRLRRTV